jgi:acyl-CoA synthetase (AMP-forming)/AMP-acid ligase II
VTELLPQHNLAAIHEAIAERVPDRECIVFRGRRLTFADVNDRSRRLAHVLHDRGLGARPGGRTGLAGHDAVVAARPSERWGQEVVAVVQLRTGATAPSQELADEAAKHIARYKLPKAWVFADTVERSPAGKADYRWAAAQAVAAP